MLETIRMLDDTYKLSKCVQIARLYLEVCCCHYSSMISSLFLKHQRGAPFINLLIIIAQTFIDPHASIS